MSYIIDIETGIKKYFQQFTMKVGKKYNKLWISSNHDVYIPIFI